MKYLSILIFASTLFFACNGDDTQPEDEQPAIDAFIAENNLTPTMTASGLLYVVIEEGTGTAMPDVNSTADVTYVGEFLDGKEFDSGTATFPLSGVIPGWTEGLQLMKKDAIYHFIIPSNLAYGAAGRNTIPPYTPLFFKVELHAFN